MYKEKCLKKKSIRVRARNVFFPNNSAASHTVKRKTNYLLNNAFSLVIYLSTFFVFYYIKKRTLILEDNYYQLLGFLAISLIVGAVLSNKFILTIHHELWQIIRKLCISLILSLGFFPFFF